MSTNKQLAERIETAPVVASNETTVTQRSNRRNPISADMARKLVDYNRLTGDMTWNLRDASMFKGNPDNRYSADRTCQMWNSRFAGNPAGKLNADGYLVVCVFYVSVMAHRLAWLIETGNWPADEIDHIDGRKHNNSFSNLRIASRRQNMCNRGMQSNNSTGFKGVRLDKRRGRFYAQITVNRTPLFLGSFLTPGDAYAAYRRAADSLHGTFSNIG